MSHIQCKLHKNISAAGIFHTLPFLLYLQTPKLSAVRIMFSCCVCDEVKQEAAHRCCSTVAAGWCCHTGFHTKPSYPTSFALALFPPCFQLFLLSAESFVLLPPLSASSSHRHLILASPHSSTHANTFTCLSSPSLTVSSYTQRIKQHFCFLLSK